jgi:hypothetical protein
VFPSKHKKEKKAPIKIKKENEWKSCPPKKKEKDENCRHNEKKNKEVSRFFSSFNRLKEINFNFKFSSVFVVKPRSRSGFRLVPE